VIIGKTTMNSGMEELSRKNEDHSDCIQSFCRFRNEVSAMVRKNIILKKEPFTVGL
jgi:hypothetical protein